VVSPHSEVRSGLSEGILEYVFQDKSPLQRERVGQITSLNQGDVSAIVGLKMTTLAIAFVSLFEGGNFC
jgi:hypothetical protein